MAESALPESSTPFGVPVRRRLLATLDAGRQWTDRELAASRETQQRLRHTTRTGSARR